MRWSGLVTTLDPDKRNVQEKEDCKNDQRRHVCEPINPKLGCEDDGQACRNTCCEKWCLGAGIDAGKRLWQLTGNGQSIHDP